MRETVPILHAEIGCFTGILSSNGVLQCWWHSHLPLKYKFVKDFSNFLFLEHEVVTVDKNTY